MKWQRIILLCAVAIAVAAVYAANEFHAARVAVYFSPSGGCTDAVVRELNAAKKSVRVQAYSFTSAPIAAALRDAKRRGVDVEAVLDKSNRTDKYAAATFLVNQGITTLIDAEHAIAHNKIIVVDEATVITGSFNFTKNAEERNAENLIIIKDALGLVKEYLANYDRHKAHSQPYHRSISSSTQQSEPQGASAGEGRFVASKKGKVFHRADCKRLPVPQNRIYFNTRDEAMRAGFTPAKDCKP